MASQVITIYHTGDLHNRTGALTRLEGLARDDSTLLVDAGDAIRGSNTLFFPREPILERMHRLGYTAMALGNREFHYLREVMGSRRKQAGFPFLAANLEDLSGRASALLTPMIEVVVSGIRLGLLGLTPVQFPPASFWTRLTGFRFTEPAAALGSLVAGLRSRCQVVILLSHAGIDLDRSLAANVAGIDLIIGGHSHTALPSPLKIGNSWIVNVGSHGTHLGRLVLQLDEATPGRGPELKSLEGELILA